jgi:hypothetical protein
MTSDAEKQRAYQMHRLQWGYALECQRGTETQPRKGRIKSARVALMETVANGGQHGDERADETDESPRRELG